MTRPTVYATQYQLDVLKARVKNITGFNSKIIGYEKRLDKLIINQQILYNEVIAINKRIDKIQKYIKQYYPSNIDD